MMMKVRSMAKLPWKKTLQPFLWARQTMPRLGRRGNVMMMTAFALIPLTMSVGAAVDYSRAARLQTKLNAAADAAALAAVTQPMMAKTDDDATAAANAMFDSQVAGIGGLTAVNRTVQVVQTGVTVTSRIATVTYTAKSINAFGGLLGMATVDIGGTSKSTATRAPNIDFYLALDTSPSMALPTTTGGFSLIDAAAGCSFACHSNKIQAYVPSSLDGLVLDTSKWNLQKGFFGTSGTGQTQITKIDDQDTYIFTARKATDSKCTQPGVTVPITTYNNGIPTTTNELKDLCVYNKDGTYVDTYWWAKNRGIRLRVTDERAAAINLMSIAANYAAENNSTYRAALYTFDHDQSFKTIASLTPNLGSVAAAASNVELAMVNDALSNGCPMTGCGGGNNYWFTSFKSVLTNMLTTMPAVSGNGTNNAGDTPQAFLFLVTDGMSDENIGSGRTRAQMQEAQITQCNTIKSRGIQIAILYTEYTAASIADDEVGQRTLVTNNIPNVAPALTRCASPGLLYTVRTDEDISTALQALFTRAVATARLLK